MWVATLSSEAICCFSALSFTCRSKSRRVRSDSVVQIVDRPQRIRLRGRI